MQLLRSHPLLVVSAALAIGAAFVIGLAVGGNPGGTAAEWSAGIGSGLAVITALALAGQSARALQRSRYLDRTAMARRRDLDLAMRLMTLVQADGQQAETQGFAFQPRSPEAEGIVYVLNDTGSHVGEVVRDYYIGDGAARSARFQRLPSEELWHALRSDVVVLVRAKADPDTAPMGEQDR
jgi:hypothetical protein